MATTEEQPITLLTMAGGAVEELFERELERVTIDILDLNTEATAMRTISVQIKIKPDENRNFGVVGVTVDSKIGATKAIGAMFSFGKRGGRAIAVEHNPAQQQLFEPLGPRNVVNIQTGEVKDGGN